MTLDAERGVHGAPIGSSTSAMPDRLWDVAENVVTKAGVSKAINAGIEAHMGRQLFHFDKEASE